jgi:hypothetical protein
MRILISSFFLVFSFQITFAQNPCEGFFPTKEGTIFEYSSYDKDGELTTIATHEVSFFDDFDGELKGEYTSSIVDFEGEELSATGYEVACKDGKLHVPYTVMLAPGMMEKYVTMDLEIGGEGVLMPASLEKGQSLEDGFTEVKVSTGDVKLITMTFEPYDRKVVGLETVETPAGKFECYKVTYDLAMKVLITRNLKVTDWYAKDIGLVKQKVTNKKGKPQGSMLLTRYSVN